MGRNSVEVHGGNSRGDYIKFDESRIVMVRGGKTVLQDDRVGKALDEALVLNIYKRGVRDPIKVRQNGMKDDMTVLEIVDGRQRYKALVEANRRRREDGLEPHDIPAFVIRGSDTAMAEEMAGSFIRTDDTPLSRAKKVSHYVNVLGNTEDDASIAYGVDIQTIRGYLVLTDTAEEVQQAVESCEVSVAVAKKLAPLSREDQVAALVELKAEGATRGARGLEAVEKKLGKPPGPKLRGYRHVVALVSRIEERIKEGEPAPDWRRVLKYVMGDDTALGQKWHPEAKAKATAEK